MAPSFKLPRLRANKTLTALTTKYVPAIQGMSESTEGLETEPALMPAMLWPNEDTASKIATETTPPSKNPMGANILITRAT